MSNSNRVLRLTETTAFTMQDSRRSCRVRVRVAKFRRATAQRRTKTTFHARSVETTSRTIFPRALRSNLQPASSENRKLSSSVSKRSRAIGVKGALIAARPTGPATRCEPSSRISRSCASSSLPYRPVYSESFSVLSSEGSTGSARTNVSGSEPPQFRRMRAGFCPFAGS
jgi:hypothetical protein